VLWTFQPREAQRATFCSSTLTQILALGALRRKTKGKTMKTSLNNKHATGSAESRVFVLAVAALLLATAAFSLAGSAEVLHKKDGGEWRMSWWLGGWDGTGGQAKLYFWMEFPQGTSVLKEILDGLFWQESRDEGIARAVDLRVSVSKLTAGLGSVFLARKDRL
jgi:hypothetical protein